jgi:hypothetical protein
MPFRGERIEFEFWIVWFEPDDDDAVLRRGPSGLKATLTGDGSKNKVLLIIASCALSEANGDLDRERLGNC